MQTTIPLVIGVAAVFLGAANLWYIRPWAGHGPSSTVQLAPAAVGLHARDTTEQDMMWRTLDGMRTAMAQLRTEMQALKAMATVPQKADVLAPLPAPPPPLPARHDQPTDPSHTEAAPAVPEPEQTAQRAAQLEDHLWREAQDAPWARGMEEQIVATLDQQDFAGSRIEAVMCQSTLCRLDLEHADEPAEQYFLQGFAVTLGVEAVEGFYTRSIDANGTVGMRLYLSRDGHRLPSGQ